MSFFIKKRSTGKVLLLLMCIAAVTVYFKILMHFIYVGGKVCGCEKCLAEDHPQFRQRFGENISPLLTRDSEITQEVFDWWKNVQLEQRDLRAFKKVTQRVFQVFPGRPPVAEPAQHRCRSCAVVGNSRNLKRSGYGKLINYHEFVFRINFGQTKGYEADVGNRTTHRVMFPESATHLDDSTHLVLCPFKIKDLQWLVDVFTTGNNEYYSYMRWMSANQDLVMVLSPTFMKYVHESWLQSQGRYPSTGFLTVMLALHICDEVSVFGFGADSDGDWSHYYEASKAKNLKTGAHPGSVEYEMLLELAKQGILTFYRGW